LAEGATCGTAIIGGGCAAGLVCQLKGDSGTCQKSGAQVGDVCGPDIVGGKCGPGLTCKFSGVDTGTCQLQ
jgi:hypothetical protein